MTTLYVHGFASSGNSSKVEQLRAILGEEVLAPSLAHRPRADFERLEAYVREHRVTKVVGSSMGGFYALALGQRFDLRVLLVNPSLRPHETARRYLGTARVYDTGETFEWTEREVGELRELARFVDDALDPARSSVSWVHVLVLLAENDEVLDARVTAKALARAQLVFDREQDHRFGDLSRHVDRIRAWARADASFVPGDMRGD